MQSSTSSSSSPPAETRHVVGDNDNDGTQDYQRHDSSPKDPPSRDVDADADSGPDSESNNIANRDFDSEPQSSALSGNVPLSSGSALRRRRQRPTENERRDHCQQSSSSPQAPEAEAERETVLPATTESLSRKSLLVLRPVHKYVDLVCICLSVVAYLLETTMNAALAIFGIGVGVGLVLGDSFRAALPLLPSVQAQQQQQHQQHHHQQQHQQTAAAGANGTAAPSEHEVFLPRDVPNLLPAQ
eukprot:jgi/Psemu1/12487/gm1.12487_g